MSLRTRLLLGVAVVGLVACLRFTIPILGRTIEADPERHTWFATYSARIDGLCARELAD